MIVDLDADEDLDKKDILNISWFIPFFGAVFAEYILTEVHFMHHHKRNVG